MNNENAVTLDEAKLTCAAWRQLYGELFPGVTDENKFRGFYIPIKDIHQFKTLYDAVAVRAYIATDVIPGTSGIESHRLRLMLVPVQADSEGNIMPGVDYIEPLGDPSNPDLVSIYDFTMPCPYQCDKVSELYDIEMGKTRKEKEL